MSELTSAEPQAVYRLSRGARVGTLVIALLLLALGMVIGWSFQQARGAALPLPLIGVLGALAVLALLIILYSWRWRLALNAQGIELQGLTGSRRLARADIAGRRRIRTRSGETVLLIPSRGNLRPLRLNPRSIGGDTRLDQWIQGLPDLDAADLKASEAAVAADSEFGSTAEERLARLKSARRTAAIITAASLALALWLYIYPVPYGALTLAVALLPWLAFLIAGASHGLYRIDSRRNDVRPTLVAAVFAPIFALLARAVFDIGVLDWPAALSWVSGVALLFAFTGWRCGLSLPGASDGPAAGVMVLWVILGALYGLGVVLLGNALLDRAARQTFSVQVLGQHVTHGRSTSYHVLLAPWGPRGEAGDVTVSRAVFQAAQMRHSVCVLEGHGALRVPWYVVRACP
jgi:hypothetical protein